MSQSPPSSNDAFNDSLSFIKKMWGGMGVPGMSGAAPSGFGMPVPSMSLEDMDKRIQELKTVESWLNVNMSMLRSTIQALEIQRATVATLHSLSSTMAQTMQSPTSDSGSEPESKATPTTPDVSPLINQSAVWWNAVQEQFKQALGAALEKSAQTAEAAKPATTPSKPARRAPRKPKAGK